MGLAWKSLKLMWGARNAHTVSIETSKRSDFSGSQSVVGFQQSAKSFNTSDLSAVVNFVYRFDYSAKGLMNPFVMIILTVLLKDIFKLPNG